MVTTCGVSIGTSRIGVPISADIFFDEMNCTSAPKLEPAMMSNADRLHAIRLRILFARRVIRRFLRNENVMRMALLHRGRAYLNEARPCPQLFQRFRPAIAHAGSQASD